MKNRKDLARNQRIVDLATKPNLDGDDGVEINGVTYTSSDSKAYAKQKRKEDRKKKISVSKVKKSAGDKLWVSSEDIKRKNVKIKRANRMIKRGWKKDLYM